jgi:hypothetical protein
VLDIIFLKTNDVDFKECPGQNYDNAINMSGEFKRFFFSISPSSFTSQLRGQKKTNCSL